MSDGAARYVYICSAGHSGSTLLDLLLGSHSRAASLGEITQLPKNIALDTECACGTPVRTCPLWSGVIRQLSADLGVDLLHSPYALEMGYGLASTVVDHNRQTKAYLLRRRLLLGLLYLELRLGRSLHGPAGRQMSRAIDNNVRIYEAVRSIAGVDVVVDSSKSYLKAVALYLHQPERTRILLLTRDGRGVMWSNIKRGDSGERAVVNWRNQYGRGLPLLVRHVPQARRMQVRYEDIAAAPAATLRAICSFAGLEYEHSMLDFRQKAHHIVNGNRMRLSGSSEVRLDEEWRRRLGSDDLALFQRIAGSLNRQLGYE
jgi:hypothetical protein